MRSPEFEAQRAHRRRTIWTVLWTVIFAGPFFGTIQGAAVPVLAQVAQMSDRLYGLLQAVPNLVLLCQIPGAILISRVAHRPNTAFIMGVWGRSLWFLIGAIPLLVPPGSFTNTALLSLIGLSWIGLHLGGLAWQSWMGDLIPARTRGRYFGVRVRVVSAANLIASVLLALTLPRAADPHARWILFATFGLASAIGVYEVVHYRGGYEPPRKRPPIRLAELLIPLQDRTFLPFLVWAFLISTSTGIVAPFLWRHLLGPLSVAPFRVTLVLQTAALLGTIVTAPLWGRWVDRHGTKAALIVAVVGSQIATLAWPAVTADRWWLGLAISILGVGFWAGVDVSNQNRLFAHAAKGGPGYLAMFNATVALSTAGATVIGGEIAERLQGAAWIETIARWHTQIGLVFNPYMVLLAICVVLRVAAVVYLSRFVKRDVPTPTIAGVRAMTGQIQTGLIGFIFLPVKRWGRAGEEQ